MLPSLPIVSCEFDRQDRFFILCSRMKHQFILLSYLILSALCSPPCFGLAPLVSTDWLLLGNYKPGTTKAVANLELEWVNQRSMVFYVRTAIGIFYFNAMNFIYTKDPVFWSRLTLRWMDFLRLPSWSSITLPLQRLPLRCPYPLNQMGQVLISLGSLTIQGWDFQLRICHSCRMLLNSIYWLPEQLMAQYSSMRIWIFCWICPEGNSLSFSWVLPQLVFY